MENIVEQARQIVRDECAQNSLYDEIAIQLLDRFGVLAFAKGLARRGQQRYEQFEKIQQRFYELGRKVFLSDLTETENPKQTTFSLGD